MALLSLDDATGYTGNALGGDPYAAAGRLTGEVAQLAPLADTYHVQGPPQPLAQNALTTPKGGALAQAGHFLGTVASSIGHIGEDAGKFLVKSGYSAATSVVRYGQGISHGLLDRSEMSSINAQNTQFTNELTNLRNQFKDGRITQSQYQVGLKGLSQDMNNLDSEANSLNNRIKLDATNAYQATLDVSGLLLTFMGAGVGPGGTTSVLTREGASIGVDNLTTQTAANYLKSKAASVMFGDTESVMSRVGADPQLYNKLPEVAKNYITRSVTEVAAAGGSMSSTQLARASAVNFALKYPVYYGMLSSTGDQVYKELDQKQYGSAIRTIAFNAALLLSGGPIGKTLYGMKKVAGVVNDATFDKTGYWDELSKYFKGDFAVEARKMAAGARDPGTGQFWGTNGPKQFIQQLSDHAATMVHSTGGDEVAAAQKTAAALKANYNFDLSTRNAGDELQSMARHAQVWKEMKTAETSRTGTLIPVRVDARSLKNLGTSVFSGPRDAWAANWETAKSQNQGWAWANNDSFDRQVKDIIKFTKDDEGAKGAESIANIRASFTAPGVDPGLAARWSRLGYVAANNAKALPFVEGEGKIASRVFGESNDMFTKMVTPLPVARSVGNMLTKIGLSPNASTQRVYQMFNANLASNLRDLPETKALLERSGAKSFQDDQQAGDYLAKKLSGYAYKPTRGKLVSKMPITDLRLLTKADVKVAVGANDDEAEAIMKSINRANLQVPMSVRGMGDRIVDKAFQFTPSGVVMRRYLRMQGALRFSWNPFYQYLRVIPKTEYLTEAKGGGIFRSLFQGRVKQINDLRDHLREVGAFDKPGSLGNLTGAEAVDSASTAETANLGKKLLPMQERSIAGLVDSQAQRMGMDSKEYIRMYPQNVRDTVQAIAQYDKHSNFLNSPLARTLNIAFFPFRFEAKVAQATAKGLANTSLLTQVSVVKGLLNAHQWLNSPEGQAWYSQNADAIGVFKYITPLANFNEVFESLLPGHDHSLGNFGELGGLPFGWIPAILDAEGLTQFNQPGVDASTGQPFPSYVPVTLKGQAAIAVQDFLGALFSYPGATVGLPSKSSATRSAALGIVGANKSRDLKLTTPPMSSLSPQAQAYAAQVGPKQSGQTSVMPLDQAPATPPTTVPTGTTSLSTPPPEPVSSAKTPKKKKSEYIPALLPGQTELGQV